MRTFFCIAVCFGSIVCPNIQLAYAVFLSSYVESGVVDHLAVIHRHTQQAAESGGATDSISGGNYGVDFLF